MSCSGCAESGGKGAIAPSAGMLRAEINGKFSEKRQLICGFIVWFQRPWYQGHREFPFRNQKFPPPLPPYEIPENSRFPWRVMGGAQTLQKSAFWWATSLVG